jgi:hypothetical protein
LVLFTTIVVALVAPDLDRAARLDHHGVAGVAQLQDPVAARRDQLFLAERLGDVGVEAPQHLAHVHFARAPAHADREQRPAVLPELGRERLDRLLRGEHLVGVGHSLQPRAHVHGVAEHVAAFGHHRAPGEHHLDRELVVALSAGSSCAAALCISHAARNAASTSPNWQTRPSPSDFTTLPPHRSPSAAPGRACG